jgi:MoaD family protein
MIITVRFFTNLREITGKRKEEIQISNSITIGDFLGILSKKFGSQFIDYLYDDRGELRSYLQVIVIRGDTRLKGLKTYLKDKDEVAILPPAGGG